MQLPPDLAELTDDRLLQVAKAYTRAHPQGLDEAELARLRAELIARVDLAEGLGAGK